MIVAGDDIRIVKLKNMKNQFSMNMLEGLEAKDGYDLSDKNIRIQLKDLENLLNIHAALVMGIPFLYFCQLNIRL